MFGMVWYGMVFLKTEIYSYQFAYADLEYGSTRDLAHAEVDPSTASHLFVTKSFKEVTSRR